ncbi:MAG: hypothetical protein QOF50_1343, partial [Gaiellaceae bacterium]|nr:hypothetical protein [Gaiellaceae bacterium]
MRGKALKLALLVCTFAAALAATGTAGASLFSGKAVTTLVFAGASDPTYLDPALVSDGESFRVTDQIF